MTGREYGLVLAIVAQRANLKGMSLEDIAAAAEKDGLSPVPVWTEAEIREVFRGEIRVELEQEHYESIVNEIEEEFFHGLSALHAKKGDA